MPDIFLSYSREDQAAARRYAEAFEGAGFSVWWDVTLRSGEAYDKVTEKALKEAKAVVVLWSPRSVESRWVRSEATQADRRGALVPVTIEACERPVMFELTQTAELAHWKGEAKDKAWLAFLADVRGFIDGAAGPSASTTAKAAQASPPSLSIAVLPFANMSDDPQQEYFSDGISEDIITDLSKVSALSVVSRNTAFQFKGKAVDVTKIAQQLNVSHVLEGSVRKAGNRVRISAQLIEGHRDAHVWAERYDRDLTDIFALQDEISEAIVKALKLKLLPEEKQAIERRGTDSTDAYDLYLMARQQYLTGNRGDRRNLEVVVRLCRQAAQVDPAYALAWALLGLALTYLRFTHGVDDIDSGAAVERALELGPDLAEAHALKSEHLRHEGGYDEASVEMELALRLDPESYEVNNAAGRLYFAKRQFADAARYFTKAASLSETDCGSVSLLITCFTALGDTERREQSARTLVERAEAILAQDRSNGTIMGFGAGALVVLGEADRAREWIRRALLVDPDNLNMRYNFACDFSIEFSDAEGALEMLGPYFERGTRARIEHAKIDPDLDPLRADPRFQAMIAAAEARLAGKAPGVDSRG